MIKTDRKTNIIGFLCPQCMKTGDLVRMDCVYTRTFINRIKRGRKCARCGYIKLTTEE